MLGDQVERCSAFAALRDDLEVVIALEERLDAAPRERLVVHDQGSIFIPRLLRAPSSAMGA